MNWKEEHKNFLRQHFLKKNLSKAEVEVVILVLQGLINREVANRLCVAEKTIKIHLENAYKKLKISRRSQLIWTLPLRDFVEVDNKSFDYSSQQKPANQNEHFIHSGIFKVSDMLNNPDKDFTTLDKV